jgi:hypothetical protein
MYPQIGGAQEEAHVRSNQGFTSCAFTAGSARAGKAEINNREFWHNIPPRTRFNDLHVRRRKQTSLTARSRHAGMQRIAGPMQ